MITDLLEVIGELYEMVRGARIGHQQEDLMGRGGRGERRGTRGESGQAEKGRGERGEGRKRGERGTRGEGREGGVVSVNGGVVVGVAGYVEDTPLVSRTGHGSS